ncbi:MAG: hypothetical protein ABI398_00020 [Devosia sp.]
MSSARYFVFSRGPHWIVALDGMAIARHESRAKALSSAIVMADLMGTMRHDSDVMLEDEGKLDLAWTYGVDPLPDNRAVA